MWEEVEELWVDYDQGCWKSARAEAEVIRCEAKQFGREDPPSQLKRELAYVVRAADQVISFDCNMPQCVRYMSRCISDADAEVSKLLSSLPSLPPQPPPQPSSPPQPCSRVRLGLQRRVPSVTCASHSAAPAKPTRLRRIRGCGSAARRRSCRATDPAIAARRE